MRATEKEREDSERAIKGLLSMDLKGYYTKLSIICELIKSKST